MFPISFVHRRLGSAALGLFTGGPAGALTGFFGDTGGGGGCPRGMVMIGETCIDLTALPPGGDPAFTPATGRVVDFDETHPSGARHRHFVGEGIPGTGVMIPGSGPGAVVGGPGTGSMAADGQAVMGAFGQPAMVPMVVGVITDKDGTPHPIRRCNRGMVLGKDELCYASIPNKWRKWPKAARAPVSASDAKCIRRAAASVGRVKKLAKSVGLKVKG